MAKRIKYIGALDRYFELSVTGKQSVWGRGDTDLRDDAEADLLLATGQFIEAAIVNFGSLEVINDDTFASATESNVPSAASVKAYVDANSGGGGGETVQNLTFIQAQTSANIASGNVIIVAPLTANLDMPAFTWASPTASKQITVMNEQDATGGRNLTIAGLDLSAGLSGQKITTIFRHDGTDYRLLNNPVWS